MRIPSQTLTQLIYTAYGNGGFNTSMRVTGGPDWVRKTAFFVEGVASGPATPQQMRLMLQTLLEDRFALKVRVVETLVRKVLTRAIPVGPALNEARAELRSQLADVRREITNLIDTLARIGASRALTTALKDRESRQAHLEAELGGLERRDIVSTTEVGRLENLARQKALEFRKVLRKRVPQARQILAKMLREKLSFRPEERDGQRGYRFVGQGSILPLLTGLVPEFASMGSQAVASPMPASWNQIVPWLRQIDGLRAA